MHASAAIRRLHLLSAIAVDDGPDGIVDALASVLAAISAPDRRAVVRHAYWRMPDLPEHALRRACGGGTALAGLAGPGPVQGGCSRCGRALRARRRGHDLPDPAALCADCACGDPAADPPPRAPLGWRP